MKLKSWRKENRLTQARAANVLGVDRVSLARWECGDRFPSPQMQARIHQMTDGAVSPNDWIMERYSEAS